MRRFRLLLAAAVVVFAGVFGMVGASYASSTHMKITPAEEAKEQAEKNGAKKSDAECASLLVKGKSTVEDCQKAPNPLLPESNEIIWGAAGFIVVFLFLWKFGLPAIKDGMNARTERIKGDLDSAEAQRTEASAILEEYKAQLADAKAESARIIEESRQTADQMRQEQEARLQTELAEMRTRAAADIDAAKVQAIADLRGEVTALAIGAAEQVVGRNLDQATNTQLVEDYINQVGANR